MDIVDNVDVVSAYMASVDYSSVTWICLKSLVTVVLIESALMQ